MSNLFVWKEQMQRFYSKNSRYIDKALQFILGIVTFAVIGSNVGFMKAAAQPIVTLALGVISAFIPLILLVTIAAVLILVHLYALSAGVVIVTAAIFLIMFIFYFRFTPKRALIVLLTPIAFVFKVPYIIPIVFGLVGTPIYVVPVLCGTVVYFLLNFVKSNSAAITSAKGLLDQITVFAQQALKNKEMWITAAAFVITLLVVYSIRRLSVNNAWKAAIIVGAVVDGAIMVVGDIVLNVHVGYMELIIGSIVAAVIALVLEFFVFSVDYSRTEHMQFEDDEYYYYIKAVPKISVTAPQKTVKRINERQNIEPTEKLEEEIIETPQETTAIDPEEIKRRLASQAENMRRLSEMKNEPIHREQHAKVEKAHIDLGKTDEMLLAKSLKEELDIQKIIEKELEK